MNHKLGGEVLFGKVIIPPTQIFLLRKNVFAIVNHRPFVKGHVLVCSRKCVPKLSDLTEIEILDLFMSAQEVSRKLSTLNHCVYNISIQNGKDSGQTVPHVHLHLCPDIHGLEKRKDDSEIRSEDDMAN